jgi:hypothetical protein
MDVVVVVGFSAALIVTIALLGEGVSVGDLVAGIVIGLLLSALAGLVVGGILFAVVRWTRTYRSAAWLIVVASALSVRLAVAAVHWPEARLGVHVEVESLLAMVAGLLVANAAAGVRLAELLERLAPIVYVVFLTLTG